MAYATDRQLLSAYAGAFLTQSGGNVALLKDQSGNGHDFAPDIGTTPVLAETPVALSFAGGNSLVGPLLTLVFGATSTWVAMVVNATTIDVASNAAVGGNVPLGDKAEGGDLSLIDNGTADVRGYGLRATQYDGAYKSTPDVAAYPGNLTVIQFRKDATKLYARINKLAEAQVAAGTLTALAYALMIGGSGTGHFFKGKVYALVGYADANIPAGRDALVQKLMTAYGIGGVPDVSGFPTAATTGPTGTLTPASGGIVLSTPGQVYQNVDMTGSIIVSANNVTVQNCKVSSADAWGIHITGGVTGVKVLNCEIDGLGTGNTIGVAYEPDAANGEIANCNIHGCEDGCRPSSGTPVHGCYIHDFASLNDSGHYDGIEMDGALSDIEIYANTVINAKGQTSCVQMNNGAGALANINVHDNYLSGGSYTFYLDAHFTAATITGINVSNNKMGIGSFGWGAINSATLTHAGNLNVATGQLIDQIL